MNIFNLGIIRIFCIAGIITCSTMPVYAEAKNDQEAGNTILNIAELKKNILSELKGQDVALIQKVMKAVDQSVVAGKPAAKADTESTLTKITDSAQKTSKRIAQLVKNQGKLIKSYADLEKTDELMNELIITYSDKMDLALDQINTATEKFEEMFADQVDSAVEQLDSLLETLDEKDDAMSEKISDLVTEINELTYNIQEEFEDKIFDLTLQMEETISLYVEKYENAVDEMIEAKEKEFEDQILSQ